LANSVSFVLTFMTDCNLLRSSLETFSAQFAAAG